MPVVLLSCSDDGGSSIFDVGPATDGGADQSPPLPDGSPALGCQCNPDEVCNSQGQCIKEPTPKPGEIVGELVLLRQVVPGGTSVIDLLGKAEADFRDQEPLPADPRKAYPTPDGSMCWYEMGTIWPHTLTGGAYWPTGPGRGAGKLTFRAGAGPIELDVLDMGQAPNHDFAYFHDQVPPPLKDGAATYSDFFDVKHIPFGTKFSVEAAGGPSIAKQVFQGGETAKEFTITKPGVEQADASAPSQQPLTVEWSPAQPDAMMEIFLTQSFGMGDIALLTCMGEDDGSLTIPAAALQNLAPMSTGVQLRRSVKRYQQLSVAQGKILHLYLIGRHARVAKYKVDLQP